MLGGGRPDLPPGYHVGPTIFADVDASSTIAQEGIFGPVLAIIPFDTDADAVRIADDSIYGLAGSVHSSSLDRALAVARQMQTGQVSVNGGQTFGIEPICDYKHSGLAREVEVWAFEKYLEMKSLGLPPA